MHDEECDTVLIYIKMRISGLEFLEIILCDWKGPRMFTVNISLTSIDNWVHKQANSSTEYTWYLYSEKLIKLTIMLKFIEIFNYESNHVTI